MKMQVLSSGSHGNCYLFTSSANHTLIVECGILMQDIKRGLKWNVRDVDGCIASHSHKDHMKSAKDIVGCGIHLYALRDTLEASDVSTSVFSHAIKPLHGYRVGEYKIFTLPVVHDVPCLAFIISHPEMGHTLFVTDTMMLEYKIPKMSHVMIECNYSDEALNKAVEEGRTNFAMTRRLLESHMELDTTIGVLQSNDLSMTNEVVLLHLSGQNSDGKEFVRRVQKATGKPTYVARKGLELEFNK